jgi:hypothetical protein
VSSVVTAVPFGICSPAVHTFRHALSLDEHRSRFQLNIWSHQHEDGHVCPTDVEQVYFAGCHCGALLVSTRRPYDAQRFTPSDVGGGSVPNENPRALARIPLRWMIRECFKSKTGIMFDSDKLRAIGLDPGRLYPDVLPRPPPLPVNGRMILANSPGPMSAQSLDGDVVMEELEELEDALTPIFDQLEIKKFWWLLEYLPAKQAWQDNNGRWQSAYRFVIIQTVHF